MISAALTQLDINAAQGRQPGGLVSIPMVFYRLALYL